MSNEPHPLVMQLVAFTVIGIVLLTGAVAFGAIIVGFWKSLLGL